MGDGWNVRARDVQFVDKLALAYVLLSSNGATPRGIESLVSKALERLAETETELRYGHFFGPRDEESTKFVRQYAAIYDALHDRAVRLS